MPRRRGGGRPGALPARGRARVRAGLSPTLEAPARLAFDMASVQANVAGLVILTLMLLATITAVLHLFGRRIWTRRVQELETEMARTNAKLDRTVLMLHSESKSSSPGTGLTGSRRSRVISPWSPIRRCRRGCSPSAHGSIQLRRPRSRRRRSGSSTAAKRSPPRWSACAAGISRSTAPGVRRRRDAHPRRLRRAASIGAVAR